MKVSGRQVRFRYWSRQASSLWVFFFCTMFAVFRKKKCNRRRFECSCRCLFLLLPSFLFLLTILKLMPFAAQSNNKRKSHTQRVKHFARRSLSSSTKFSGRQNMYMKGKRARSCIMYGLQYNDLAFGIKNKEEEEEKSRLFTKRESKLTQSEAIHTNRQQVNLEQLCTSLSHCLRICVYIRCLYTTDGRTESFVSTAAPARSTCPVFPPIKHRKWTKIVILFICDDIGQKEF